MKKIFYALALVVVLLSCNVQLEKKSSEEPGIDMVFDETDSTDIGFQRFDSVMVRTWDNEGNYFGMIESRQYTLDNRHLFIPKVDGLYWRNCQHVCKIDTCTADYAFIAVRCPENDVLMNWVSDQVKKWAKYNIIADTSANSRNSVDRLYQKRQHSAKEICDFCISEIDHYFKGKKCNNVPGEETPNEQNALMIIDVWNTKQYYTFMEATWYDQLSNGDHTRFSYNTLDLETGKELKFKDYISDNDTTKLKKLIVKHICYAGGELIRHRYKEYKELPNFVLQSMNGCALMPMGFLVYYYPYILGGGADGHAFAVIPYDELEKEGIKLKVKV